MASQRLTLEAGIVTFERPDEVLRAVASCRRPEIARVVVLDSGSRPPVPGPPGAAFVRSEENVGPCAGRNRLVEEADSDLVLLVDDDGYLADSSDLDRVIGLFVDDPRLAVVAGVEYRIGETIAKHEFPRRRVTDVGTEGSVGYFVEGACVVRRSAFLEVGGFDTAFFCYHEGPELALRLAHSEYTILYSPSLRLEHRPSQFGRTVTAGANGRELVNREVLATRNLPVPIRWVHILVWRALYLLRAARDGLPGLARFRAQASEERSRRLGAVDFPRSNRLGMLQCIRLHRIGYRVFW